MHLYSKSDSLDMGIGLLLPTSSIGDIYFNFILDEQNQIWYVDKDKFHYSKEELSYPVVFFNKGDDYRAYNIKFCDYNPTANKISSRWDISEGEPYVGIPYEEYFITGYNIRKSNLFYSDYGVAIFLYYKNNLNDPSEYRLFIVDEKRGLYHQVNKQFARVISILLSRQSTMKLPVDGKSIYDIYKLLNKKLADWKFIQYISFKKGNFDTLHI
jgi:hypothetical protein